MSGLFELIATRIDHDAVFIRYPDATTLSYSDMLMRSAAFASVLQDAGIGCGDRIIVQMQKCTDMLLLYLAALRIGAIFVPLNPDYTGAELAYFIADADPRLVIVDPDAEAAVAVLCSDRALMSFGVGGTGSFAAAAAKAPPCCRDHPAKSDDLAAILYTSGTTGRSKGAMLSHGNLASNALTLVDYWGIRHDDILLHALPIFHTHGLFVATNTILLAGASMLFLPRFDVDMVIRLLPQATTMMGVPTFYTRLLARADFDKPLLRSMRLFISGSAPLPAAVHRAFGLRTGHVILERYGMTETNMNTSNPLDGERCAGTVGFPLPDVALRLVDRVSGEVVAAGEIGMIEVRGANICQGYWRDTKKTASVFRDDGFFATGDLGYFDDKGYLTLVGRDKDLIISGGLNVYPVEVEDVLNAHDGVTDCAVIGLPHADFGEAVTAIIVAVGDVVADIQAIDTAMALVLAPYKRPKRVIFVDQLPRNSMGKVEKNVLRQRYCDLYADSAAGAD